MTATTTTMGRRVALAAITDPSKAPSPGPLTALLVDDTHVFGAEFSFVSDITDEISATGYARTAVVTVDLTDQSDGRVSAEFAATSFGLVGGALDATIGGCYLYLDSGVEATSPVVMAIPFSAPQTTDGTDLTIVWNPIAAEFLPRR